MDRGACWAIVHGEVAKNWTKRLNYQITELLSDDLATKLPP